MGYVITSERKGYIMRTKRRNAEEAFCDMMPKFDHPIEVVEYGIDDNAAERLGAMCREVIEFK